MKCSTVFLGLVVSGLLGAPLAFADSAPDVVCLSDGVQTAPLRDGKCTPGALRIDAKAWRESGDKVVVTSNGHGVLLEPAAFDNRFTYLLVRNDGGLGGVRISTRRECDKLATQYNGQCMTAAQAKAEFARAKSAR
ncbi:hypothetical protein [Paraburkholderia sp. SIMBA_054]|uniref:hypothetical protein n=1 Tax=Paraburkholderia sp. SIMBA_054 TaxID=3085795 RepID=UPI003978AD94